MRNYTPNVNGQLQQKLRDLRKEGRLQANNRNAPKNPMQSAMDIGVDGVDHINIWEHGVTELGKVLAHSTQIPFQHSVLGRFNSVDCFWHYVRSQEKDDRIRTLRGPAAKEFAKLLTQIHVKNFRAIIMDANYQKIVQNPAIMEAIYESEEVPFDCYYTHRGSSLRTRPTFAHWLLKGFTEIRNAIQAGRDPNFDFLKDSPKSGLWDGIVVVEEKVVKPVEITGEVPAKKKSKKKHKLKAEWAGNPEASPEEAVAKVHVEDEPVTQETAIALVNAAKSILATEGDVAAPV